MKIAPSLLSANFYNLEAEFKTILEADYIHLDVMDGVFVPNISFGLSVIDSLKECPLLKDIHLMILNPLQYIDDFARCNPEIITFHCESESDIQKTIDKIKNKNIKVGISLKPNTSLEVIKPYLKDVDLVLVMTVEPGFGGQKFMPNQVYKIEELARIRKENNYHYLIEVDGGINEETAHIVKKAQADIAVAGSYVFKAKDRNQAIKDIR